MRISLFYFISLFQIADLLVSPNEIVLDVIVLNKSKSILEVSIVSIHDKGGSIRSHLSKGDTINIAIKNEAIMPVLQDTLKCRVIEELGKGNQITYKTYKCK